MTTYDEIGQVVWLLAFAFNGINVVQALLKGAPLPLTVLYATAAIAAGIAARITT